MAGFYPDPPAHRIPYDLNGTLIIQRRHSDNSLTQKVTADLIAMNDESLGIDNGNSGGFGVVFNGGCDVVAMFPDSVDITGIFLAASGYNMAAPSGWAYSNNTTNGLDGNWTAISPAPTVGNGVFYTGTIDAYPAMIPQYRTNIWTGSVPTLKAIKFVVNSAYDRWGISLYHLYGSPSVGSTIDRLEFWHPTLDQKIQPALLDFGDIPRGQLTDRQFRIKNISPALTAQTIGITRSILTEGAPSVLAMHSLSTDGTNFATTISIGDLSPGAISSVLTVRQTASTTAPLGLRTVRLHATPVAWV